MTTPGAQIAAASQDSYWAGCAGVGRDAGEAAEAGPPLLLLGSASDGNDGVKKCLVGKVNRYKANK